MSVHTFMQLIICLSIFLISCKDSVKVVSLQDGVESNLEDFVEESDGIFLTDQTGKRWDITHAVNTYGFKPENFGHGLGPNAIEPIINAEMIGKGEAGYPERNANFPVVGANIDFHVRAYSLYVLAGHEVINETFGDKQVAVCYCPIVGLTAVYSREIDGRVLTLSASGWTYDGTFVLYDYETTSLWYPLPGVNGLTCVGGLFADKKLPELQSSTLRWNLWTTKEPLTKFIKYP